MYSYVTIFKILHFNTIPGHLAICWDVVNSSSTMHNCVNINCAYYSSTCMDTLIPVIHCLVSHYTATSIPYSEEAHRIVVKNKP